MKRSLLPVALSLLLLFSCENQEECGCVKMTYSYGGDYPVFTEEEVDCPDGLEINDYVIEWREDQRIDYIIERTCF